MNPEVHELLQESCGLLLDDCEGSIVTSTEEDEVSSTTTVTTHINRIRKEPIVIGVIPLNTHMGKTYFYIYAWFHHFYTHLETL